LDLVHNFIIFDKGIKKVCRYNQYYAIKRAQYRLTEEKRGGIIWHTQGSGKTLSMIWLSKWILANNPTARVLIVTDREELDDQVEKAYKGVDENIVRTKSGADLVAKLNSYEYPLICSLIHKFGKNGGEATDKDIDKYIEEIKKALPADYSAKGNFVVFVDECHRTQSGKLHIAMKTIIPDGIFVGFTGTPLLKRDKKTSLETFGGYIHTYKFDEAVRDGVVLDLRYEYRDIPQEIKSQDKIDTWFEIKTKGLTPRAQARLKSMWATMQKVFSSRSRLEKIALDIKFDFETKSRLMDGNGNAMLVAGSVYAACKYYEIFQQIGFKKCAIITSYEPQAGDLRTDTVSDDEETETFAKYEIYQKMLGDQSVEDFEKEVKRKFINEPANMKLLIVVDKLLTGFDAPPCTYLYIDKAMHDHGLFQAICRVNRLDDESKDFGYIVDYKQLFGDLADAINTYTVGAFEDYDKEDVDGLIKNRLEASKNFFFEVLDALDELCEGVAMPRSELDYIHYFCGENGVDLYNDDAFARSREMLYKLVSRLIRAFAEFKPRMDDAGVASDDQAKLDDRVNMYIRLREIIGRASGDFLDYKQYEPGMRHLIDNYIVADDAEKIAMFDDFTLLDFILAQEDKLTKDGDKKDQDSAAEAIENNIRKKVVQRIVINPAYYSKMSEVLEQLILERKQGVISYTQLLERYLELAKNVTVPEDNDRYPESIRKSGAMRTFYDNCGEDEKMAIRLHRAVMSSKTDDFRNNPVKEIRIKRAMYQVLKDDDMVERLYKIVVEQEEY
jgi:type I restriction enzyme R subunit